MRGPVGASLRAGWLIWLNCSTLATRDKVLIWQGLDLPSIAGVQACRRSIAAPAPQQVGSGTRHGSNGLRREPCSARWVRPPVTPERTRPGGTGPCPGAAGPERDNAID